MGKPSQETDAGELGPELAALLAKASPPKAPAWLAARTLARLRDEEGLS